MTYRKTCDCNFSSSGPRCAVIKDEYKRGTDSHVITVTLVSMACDECNTPWEAINGNDI